MTRDQDNLCLLMRNKHHAIEVLGGICVWSETKLPLLREDAATDNGIHYVKVQSKEGEECGGGSGPIEPDGSSPFTNENVVECCRILPRTLSYK